MNPYHCIPGFIGHSANTVAIPGYRSASEGCCGSLSCDGARK